MTQDPTHEATCLSIFSTRSKVKFIGVKQWDERDKGGKASGNCHVTPISITDFCGCMRGGKKARNASCFPQLLREILLLNYFIRGKNTI